MQLNDLQDKLYSKQSDISSRKPQTDTFDPRSKVGDVAETEPQGKGDPKESKDWIVETNTTKRQKTLLTLILSAVGGLVVLGGLVFLIYQLLHKDFYQQQVKLEIVLPPAVNLNEEISIRVNFANNNPVDLKNGHLTIETPLNFKITSTEPQADNVGKFSAEWNLETIIAQKTGSLEVKGKFVSREEGSAGLKANLTYMPDNFSSSFKNEATGSTEVVGIPIGLSLTATRTVSSGYAVSYKLFVKNNGKDPFQNLKVNLEYPSGFSFTGSTLPLLGAKNDVWNIPTILSGEEKALTVEGKLEGTPGDQKVLIARLGNEDQDGFNEYVKKEEITTITEPPIAISQGIKDKQTIVRKGDDLFLTVSYANKSDRAIGQVIIKAKLEGVIFDFKNVNPENGGWFDPNSKEIVWQGGKTPELSSLNPGDKGELIYRVKVANFIPFTLDKKTNFTGKSTVSADSPQMPVSIGENKMIIGNSLELKLSSEVGLKSSAFYSDGTLPNSGPIPPTVGKKTTYTVHWTLTNAFNDLRGVEIKTVLPYGVEWMDQVFPQKKGVTYQGRTREVIWNLERVPAGAGGELPSANLIFQVGVTPSESDVGKTVEILGKTELKTTDTFTNETLTASTDVLDTSVPGDSSIGEGMGMVAKPGEEGINLGQ